MTKIAVLCGGQGRRIRPLTEEIPKPLVEVGGRPILDHVIDFYKGQGYADFIFCVGYKGEKIREFVGAKNAMKASFSDLGEGASMLQRVHALRDLMGEELIVAYGDTFTDIRLDDLAARHRASGKWVTIVTAKIRSPYGLIKFDDVGEPIFFDEKPVLNYYIGKFMINKKAFEAMSDDMLKMKDGDGLVRFFNALIEKKQVNVYEHDKTILTFNTQEERADAERKLDHFYSLNEAK